MMLFLLHAFTIILLIIVPIVGLVLLLSANVASSGMFLLSGILPVFVMGWGVGFAGFMKEILENLNSINSPYPFARKKVAKKLAKEYTSESVGILANAVVLSDDKAVVKISIAALNRLHSQELIDTFCEIWERTRNKDLEIILKNRQYVSTKSKIRVLSALKVGKLDALKQGDVEAIDQYILSAIEDKDIQIAKAASNYEPSNTQMKVIFYFLSGQWEKYENLDFDQSWLAKAYKSGSPELQQRITKKSRQEGRFELVKILTDTKNEFHTRSMKNADWRAVVDIIATQPDKKQIRRFLNNAPILWSKELLDKLTQIPLDQFKKSEKIALKEIFSIAKQFQDKDLKVKISKESCRSFKCETFLHRDYLFGSLTSDKSGLILVTNNHNKSIYSLPDENLVKYNKNKEDVSDIVKPLTSKLNWFNPREISPDERILVISHGSNKIKLFSLPDMKHLKTLNVKGTIKNIVISPNSHILVVTFFNSSNVGLHIWSLPSGKHLKTTFIARHTIKNIVYVKISPDNRFLVANVQSGHYGYPFYVWSLPDGNCLGTTNDYSPLSTSFMISPNNLLCCGYANGSIHLYDIESSSYSTLSGHTDDIYCFYISSDNRFLASGSDDNTIHLWSLPDGKLLTTLSGHTDSIRSLVISSDNRFLASGSDDNTIHLWSLPDGQHLTTLSGHTDSIRSLVISSDNRFLASSSSDGTIRLWSSPTDIPIYQFTSRDIIEIERKSKDSRLEEGTRNAFKFTLALIRLRQQFDIDIEDSSNDIQSSEFDIEIDE